MTRPVLLNCAIKAEIRAVDIQSDLTILYSYDYSNNDNDNLRTRRYEVMSSFG